MSPSVQAEAAKAFRGCWVDDEGAAVTFTTGKMVGPDGHALGLEYLGASSCTFTAHGERYVGHIDPEGRLQWDDGLVWVRHVESEFGPPARARALALKAAAPQKSTASSTAGDKAIAEREARRAAALERVGFPAKSVLLEDDATRKARVTAALERAQAVKDAAARRMADSAEATGAGHRDASVALGGTGGCGLLSKEQALERACARAVEARRAHPRVERVAPKLGSSASSVSSVCSSYPAQQPEEEPQITTAAIAVGSVGLPILAEFEEEAKKSALQRERTWADGTVAGERWRLTTPLQSEKQEKNVHRQEVEEKEDEERHQQQHRQQIGQQMDQQMEHQEELSDGNDEELVPQEAAPELLPNVLVRMHGLVERPHINGMVGLLVKYDLGKGRWHVRASGHDMLLKEENLAPMSHDEFQSMQEVEQDDLNAEAEATAIKTRASDGKMRWCDDAKGAIVRGPGHDGNDFDLCINDDNDDNDDGESSAERIADALHQRGVCLCAAEAPEDVLSRAYDEAEALWEAGAFGPPMRIYDVEGQAEAELWKDTLYRDEERVLWLSPEEPDARLAETTKALLELSENMLEFVIGLKDVLHRKVGVSFTHMWNAMLSCYTGDRTYALHVDNLHGNGKEAGLMPDNGLRLTVCYYINPHWNPGGGDGCNGGGLDVFLTDPHVAPSSAAEARGADRLRVAPHADSLVLFLSESIAHQVIKTRDRKRWFCLTLWCFDEEVMAEFFPRVSAMRRRDWEARCGSPHDSDDECK